MKKRNIFIVILLGVVLSLVGCNRDDIVEKSLPGEWVEVWPESDRTALIFTAERMTRVDAAANEEIYTYEVKGDSIYLQSVESAEGTSVLYFNKLEPGRFKIGNLYPSTPESEPLHMIFEKE